MIGMALRDGLRAWLRAPIRAGFGAAATLGVWLLAYALVIEVSANLWLTLLLWGLIANLALGGWILFCGHLVTGQSAPWKALFSGYRRPLAVTLAGLVAAGLVLIPTLSVGHLAAFVVAPEWLARPAVVAIACLTAPAAAFMSLEAASGIGARRAVAHGTSRAFRHWPALAALALLTFGLVAAGPLPGLLLERHALAQIAGLLPSELAEFALASVRFVALLGGIVSVSAAGCVLAAAWRATDAK